jgi:hypothetical protein
MEKKTIVINAFGGPGAGKTSAAWEIASELKKRGLVVEYVPEYAKELVWAKKWGLLDGSIANQMMIADVIKKRLDYLIGNVEVVVTDSPLIMTTIYLNKAKTSVDDIAAFNKLIFDGWNGFHNFNFFINRNPDAKAFEPEGRMHTFEESKAIDASVKEMLKENRIYCRDYDQQSLGLVIGNIISHYDKVKNLEVVQENLATQKQIYYATKIAEALGKEVPSKGRKDVSEFIEKNQEDYRSLSGGIRQESKKDYTDYSQINYSTIDYNAMIEGDITAFKNIPKKDLTYDLCEKVVSRNPEYLLDMPGQFQEQLYVKAAQFYQAFGKEIASEKQIKYARAIATKLNKKVASVQRESVASFIENNKVEFQKMTKSFCK